MAFLGCDCLLVCATYATCALTCGLVRSPVCACTRFATIACRTAASTVSQLTSSSCPSIAIRAHDFISYRTTLSALLGGGLGSFGVHRLVTRIAIAIIHHKFCLLPTPQQPRSPPPRPEVAQEMKGEEENGEDEGDGRGEKGEGRGGLAHLFVAIIDRWEIVAHRVHRYVMASDVTLYVRGRGCEGVLGARLSLTGGIFVFLRDR